MGIDSPSTIPGRTGIWKCWFLGRGENRSYPKKNFSGQEREPTTNSTHVWHTRRDLNSGHTGGM